MVNFPSSLDTLSNPISSDTMSAVPHASQHADANDILEALEAKVGVDGSVVTTSHDYKLSLITSTSKAVPQTATALTQGSIPFAGASGVITDDNDGLFWNAADIQLNIGGNTDLGGMLGVQLNDSAKEGIVIRATGTTFSENIFRATRTNDTDILRVRKNGTIMGGNLSSNLRTTIDFVEAFAGDGLSAIGFGNTLAFAYLESSGSQGYFLGINSQDSEYTADDRPLVSYAAGGWSGVDSLSTMEAITVRSASLFSESVQTCIDLVTYDVSGGSGVRWRIMPLGELIDYANIGPASGLSPLGKIDLRSDYPGTKVYLRADSADAYPLIQMSSADETIQGYFDAHARLHYEGNTQTNTYLVTFDDEKTIDFLGLGVFDFISGMYKNSDGDVAFIQVAENDQAFLFGTGVDGDTLFRWSVKSSGEMIWGDGGVSDLIVLEKSDVGTLSLTATKLLLSGEIEIDGALNHEGSTIGVFGTAPTTKQTVSGSRGGNAALASLLTALASYGLITNSTTA